MRVFTRHPATAGETYGEHLATAFSFGFAMFTGGLAAMTHGLLPFLFETTGSRRIDALHARLTEMRARRGG